MKKSDNNVVSLFEQTNQGVQKAVLTNSMKMKRGGSLSNPILAYETWGKLSKQKDNVVVILTGLSASSHVASHSNNSKPELYNIGCLGKITSFNESEDGRYLIILNGLSRFKIIDEIENNKLYRECNVSFNEFKNDINSNEEEIKFTDLELIFKNLKNLFQKKGYIINWKELEKQDLNQTINTLAMASPFSLEEKQALLETQNLISRKFKLEEIIKTYILDDFSNTTIQ